MPTFDPAPVTRERPTRLVVLLMAMLVAFVAVLPETLAGAADDPQTGGTPRDAAAASWLADQLTDGDHFESVIEGVGTFNDQGLTVDTVLALAAAGTAEGFAADATAWLSQESIAREYVGDGTTTSFAGALGKLSLLAQVRGLDATSFGTDNIDLIAELENREQTNGRFTDTGYGDYSNSIGQSLAIIALVRQPGTTPSDAAVDLLLGSRCADGGFALELEPAACTSGTDTTAYALQALLAIGRAGDTGAIDGALGYLLDAQQTSGGFATASTGDANANSTALSTQALRAAGENAAADAGSLFLASLQVDCDGAEAQRGALAFDATGFDASNAARATAQGILGMSGVGFAQLSSAGASSAQPRFDCSTPTTPSTDAPTADTPATDPTAPGTPGAPVSPVTNPGGRSPAATPVVANPTYTG